jgi:predicted nucleotidyltransferase
MQAALNALVEALQRYQPQRIILFGSAARGEADEDSDLDVLVIKDTPESFVQRLEAMARLCPSGVHADILVYTPVAGPALPQPSTSTAQRPWHTPSPPANGSRARSQRPPFLSVAPPLRW